MLLWILMPACWLSACATQAPPPALTLGEQLDFAGLQDQYGQPFPLEQQMTLLIFTDAMAASRQVRDALRRLDPTCLESGRVIFVADVSGMPRLITQLIAVPKMRGYGFPIWLDYDGAATAALPVREDQVSLLQVDGGVITGLRYVRGMEAVINAAGDACKPSVAAQ